MAWHDEDDRAALEDEHEILQVKLDRLTVEAPDSDEWAKVAVALTVIENQLIEMND